MCVMRTQFADHCRHAIQQTQHSENGEASCHSQMHAMPWQEQLIMVQGESDENTGSKRRAVCHSKITQLCFSACNVLIGT